MRRKTSGIFRPLLIDTNYSHESFDRNERKKYTYVYIRIYVYMYISLKIFELTSLWNTLVDYTFKKPGTKAT